MEIYGFISRRWSVRALTTDITGANLPADYAPWDPQDGGAPILMLTSENVLYDVLRRRGFFLTSVSGRPPTGADR
jgi:hypothetical protein